MTLLDLAQLDVRVARAQKSYELARLQTEDDPFDAVREVTSRTTFLAVKEYKAGESDTLLRDALLRWIHELLQARIGWDLMVAERKAIAKVDPALPAKLDVPIARTFEEAFGRMLASPARELGRLAELAAPVVAVRREARARRDEIAYRLDLAAPWALAADTDKLRGLAESFLSSTDAIAEEARRRLPRGGGQAGQVIEDAFAKDAQEGWPARLGRRWLDEALGITGARPPRVVRVPQALGGASFVRAANAWGIALRLNGTARSLPFALANDPYPTEAWLWGSALASLVADRVFARKKLGLSARSSDAHARILARSVLVTLRSRAAMMLAADPEELGGRVFGEPLPSPLGALWALGGFSGAARIDAPARFLGALRAFGFVKDLVDRFDEDWFDNPRAHRHLVGIATGPVWSSDFPAEDTVKGITRAFEENVG